MDDKILMRTLKSTPFFYELSQEEFDEVVKEIKIHRLKRDVMVIRERDRGESLFFVVHGILRATMNTANDSKVIPLSNLEVGNFFGEYSFLTGRLRSASISTITDSELLEIPKDAYRETALRYSSVRRFLIDLCYQHQEHTKEVLASRKINRRRFSRFKVNGKIKFQEFKKERDSKIIKLGTGTLVDVAESGMSFRIKEDAIEQHELGMYGKEYKARVEIEGAPVPIKVLGKVVSFEVGLTKRELADWYLARMKFVKIDKNDKKVFAEFLNSCKRVLRNQELDMSQGIT